MLNTSLDFVYLTVDANYGALQCNLPAAADSAAAFSAAARDEPQEMLWHRVSCYDLGADLGKCSATTRQGTLCYNHFWNCAKINWVKSSISYQSNQRTNYAGS